MAVADNLNSNIALAVRKPITTSVVFDSGANRMVVTAIFPTRDGALNICQEKDKISCVVAAAIRDVYHKGEKLYTESQVEACNAELNKQLDGRKQQLGEAQAEIARLQEIVTVSYNFSVLELQMVVNTMLDLGYKSCRLSRIGDSVTAFGQED